MEHENGDCVYRCRDGKSYNRHFPTNGLQKCVNLYDIFDDVGANNSILVKAKELNSLGGSLTQPLSCGKFTNIETFYSANKINETEMKNAHFVEIITKQF